MGNNEEIIAQLDARLREIKDKADATVEISIIMNMMAILKKGAMAAQRLMVASDGAVIDAADMESYNAILSALNNSYNLESEMPKQK